MDTYPLLDISTNVTKINSLPTKTCWFIQELLGHTIHVTTKNLAVKLDEPPPGHPPPKTEVDPGAKLVGCHIWTVRDPQEDRETLHIFHGKNDHHHIESIDLKLIK